MGAFGLLQVLGHRLRWQVVSELSRSDLRVGELTAATGQPQNLVSYHLRLLRETGLVHERRGSADGRDVYYSLDRRAVTMGLHRAIAALDPGAGMVAPAAPFRGTRSSTSTTSVLFLCTGNSARSQIAEAILRQLAGQRVLVRSAGTHPVGVHRQVRRVLAARGIRAGTLRSKSFAEFSGQRFDYVVTLCDIARDELIRPAGKPQTRHWSIADPAVRGGRTRVATAFERVTDEIQLRVEDLYADLLHRRSAA
ncbi:MAG TPA: metalloregulator ArsR/SmtB family transcription factor [Candidatus Dormibacteraeota bacterium]|nr:metalloregulator ArsR/SmtB family transcription factor [Candidatus Dormibacteraeota bacterium]